MNPLKAAHENNEENEANETERQEGLWEDNENQSEEVVFIVEL